jgi:hypothetical protein
MISARSGQLVLLGLSRRNVELLTAGKPIDIDGARVGLPGIRIAIMFGETEQDMLVELRPFITAETKITEAPNG